MKCSVKRGLHNKRVEETLNEGYKRDLYNEVNTLMSTVIEDREIISWCKAQWVLLVATYRAHGHAKKRLSKTLREVQNILPSLLEDNSAGVLEDMLINDLERIGLNIRETHKEYFEAAERQRQFEKYISKEIAREEAERKEREFLEKNGIKNGELGKEFYYV